MVYSLDGRKALGMIRIDSSWRFVFLDTGMRFIHLEVFDNAVIQRVLWYKQRREHQTLMLNLFKNKLVSKLS
jgi:hypothetical protein